MTRLGRIILLLTLFAPSCASAQQTVPPTSPVSQGASPALVALEAETRAIETRLVELRQNANALASYEAQLSDTVADLKRRPQGMVRDAQLQGALKELRTILAARLRLGHSARILITTLKTRQVALARTARSESTRLIHQAERLASIGDNDAARAHFARAFDPLTMRHDPAPKPPPALPQPLPPLDQTLVRSGTETPDELRELAIILRDVGERANLTASTLKTDLSRLEEERETMESLSAQVTFHPLSEAAIRKRLNAHIAALATQIKQLQNHFVIYLGRAANLEERARQEERILLSEHAP